MYHTSISHEQYSGCLFKKKMLVDTGIPPVAKWVKDPILSLKQLGFYPWPGTSIYALGVAKKKKRFRMQGEFLWGDGDG